MYEILFLPRLSFCVLSCPFLSFCVLLCTQPANNSSLNQKSNPKQPEQSGSTYKCYILFKKAQKDTEIHSATLRYVLLHLCTRLFAIKRDYSRLFAIILDSTCKQFKPQTKKATQNTKQKFCARKHPKKPVVICERLKVCSAPQI